MNDYHSDQLHFYLWRLQQREQHLRVAKTHNAVGKNSAVNWIGTRLIRIGEYLASQPGELRTERKLRPQT